MAHRIVLLPGDGIGPEVTAAARLVLDASGAELDWDVHQVGLAALAAGETEPLPARTVRAIADCGTALKGPLTTPLDGSMASMNMALRRELDLHVQLRHVRRFAGVPGHHEQVDLVVVRQTTEDVFVGIEFAAGSEHAEELAEWLRARGKQLPPRSALAVKVSSAAGARRAFTFAAGYARRHDRRLVTAVHKATVLPETDGLFLRVGREVVAEHPDLDFEAVAVDALAARLVGRPESLDVLVAPSQYGDIMADLGAALVGGVGMVAGGNFGGGEQGRGIAVFEPAHGSAPRCAGQDRANPVATILSGALALHHLGEREAALRVEAAVCTVLAGSRYRTYDLTSGRSSVGAVGTVEFARSVADAIL